MPTSCPRSSDPTFRSRSGRTTAAASDHPTRPRRSSCARPTRCAASPPRPGELGFGRAYVAGDLDVEGDMYEALELRHRLPNVTLTPSQWLEIAKVLGPGALRPLPPPPGEARLRGRRHSPARRRCDRAPLQRLERVLPATPRAVAHLLVCGVGEPGRRTRSRAGCQARPRVPQARAATRHAPARRGMRMGKHAAPRGAALRRAGRGCDALATRRPTSASKRDRRGGARRPRDGAGAGLPRRRRRAVRRDQLDRHVRARRA